LKRRILLGLICFLTFVGYGYAQGGAATLRGTVTDPAGSMLPSAKVTVTQVGTGLTRSVVTDAKGGYIIPQLAPADYTLKVEAEGFSPFTQKGIVLQADQSVTDNVALHVGSATQTVVVESAAALVDTTTATLNEVVNQTQVLELPLNGRNAASLTSLVAGTSPAPSNGGGALQGITKEFPSQVTVSTSGTQEDQVSYLLDGATYNDILYSVNMPFQFPDSLEEFSVQTSNYAAQYGNNSGGVVNVITKSGTNDLHGNVFEFNRNAVFDGRNYFAAKRDQLKQNQFGGILGGPVFIPRLYNGKERTFFFFGYQGTLVRDVGSTTTIYAPTQAEINNGDFSAYLSATNPNNPLKKAVTLINPSTGKAYPGNLIPTGSYSAAALNMVKYLPTVTGNGVNYYTSRIHRNQNEFVYRVDEAFNSADHLTFRGTWNHLYNDGYYNPANLASLAGYSDLTAQDYLLHETHIFKSNLLNEARFSYGREYVSRGPESGAPGFPSLGVKLNYDPAPQAIYSFSVSGFFSVSEYPLAIFARQSYAGADDLSWVKGRHNLQFGFSAERVRVDLINQGQAQPGFNFSASNGTGLALANFLLGDIYKFTQQQGEPGNLRDTFLGFYAQDSFHASKRLTLNYGVRWEPGIPWDTVQPAMNYFMPGNYSAGVHSTVYPNAPKGLLFHGDTGVPGYIGYDSNMKAVMPRVGFAYDIFGNGKTSLRGGAGLFYDTRMSAALMNTVVIGNSPYNPTLTLTTPTGTFDDPYAGITDPFPQSTVPGSNATFVSPLTVQTVDASHKNEVIPAVGNWNLAIEQQLGVDWLLRVAYVGNRGWHIRELAQLDPAVYAAGATTSTTQARRVFPEYSSITQMTMDAVSMYHGGQLSLEKRFEQQRFLRGLKLLANYTFSKTLDDLPYLAGVENTTVSPVSYWDTRRHAFDYGPSDFNHKHVSSISYEYRLPGMSRLNRGLRPILGSWELTGILTMYSGDPLTVLSGVDNSRTGIGQDRAVLTGTARGTGACGTTAPCVDYLNPSSFTTNTVGTYGSVGKGQFTGPHFIDWDMGIFKSFDLIEKAKLQFRAEFFNIFNHTNLLDPATTRSSAGFGSITSAADPRIGQLAMKISF
jgi:hypothetical protein